ncbi:MAG: tryptophan-rich sensory protein [Patescibacteria group bacterium]|nr:tryptophan-rich sensory protein [Patescibacteria group bacterium]
MKPKDIVALVIAIIIAELAGAIGAVFTTAAIPSWYAGLTKPALTPPSWVFAPVWTLLYALMGVALFLVWKKHSYNLGIIGMKNAWAWALAAFFFQLALNVLWSYLFFGLHSPGAAFVEIVILWLAIIANIVAFAKISVPAAWLLIPYVLWVSFAAYLNFAIWRLTSV